MKKFILIFLSLLIILGVGIGCFSIYNYRSVIASWFGGKEISRLEKENTDLKTKVDELQEQLNSSVTSELSKKLINRSITKITKEDLAGVTQIGDYAFAGCYSLKSIDIPDTVTYIGEYAFDSCIGLTSINLPNSITWLSNHVFNRTHIESIDIPSSVTHFGSAVFEDVTRINYLGSLEQFLNIEIPALQYLQWNADSLEVYINGDSLETLNIPYGITEISSGRFTYVSNIKNVILSDTVTTIGEKAFAHCKSLETIKIPSSVKNIENGAFDFYFSDCSLKSVTIDSADIYTAATGSYGAIGGLLQYLPTVKVLKSIVDNPSYTNTYLNNESNYTKTIDGEYYVYTKAA